MRLSKRDYKLLAYLLLLVSLCWSGRFLLFVRPAAPFPLDLKWQTDLGRSTYERPAYQDGLVLFPANGLITSHWYGFEAGSGEIVWSRSVKRNSFRRCLTEDYLVVSGSRSFLALQPKTGKFIWGRERAGPADCSDTSVFAIFPRSNLRALELPTGREIWLTTTPFESFGGVIYNYKTNEVIADGAVIVDPASGRLLRTFEPPFVGYAPEQVGSRGPVDVNNNGELFVGGTVRDAQTGEIIHKENTYNADFAPTVTLGSMYLSSGYTVVAYDRANYDIKWVYSAEPVGGWLPVLIISPVAVLDGVGYVIYSDATLRAIDLETGQELGYWQPSLWDRWRWPVCVPLPFPFCTGFTGVGMATSDDTLFVSFGDGKLYAFGK